MRVEFNSEDEFILFINCYYKKINNYNDKNEIIKFVKEIFLKYRRKFNMRGFYKVNVYVEERVGLFLDVVRLEALDSDNLIDLRIIVNYDEDIYFKTSDYFVIKDVYNIKYFDGYYYCLIKNIKDINTIIEFGDFVCGRNILTVLDNASSI